MWGGGHGAPPAAGRRARGGAGEEELKEDDVGAELVAATAGDEEGVLRAVCDAFAADDSVGGSTMVGRARADDNKDDADGGTEGGAVASGATGASDDDAEGVGTVRCATFTQDDDEVEETLAAGFTTGAGTDD